ncbi:ATP synthase F0 subcomplex subunit OSCP atp5 [Saitoella coloradoensis]
MNAAARAVLRARAPVMQVRGYAAAKNVQPPVQLFGVSGTYASALYTAAAKTTSVDSADKALSALKGLVTKDAKLNAIISNPSLSVEDKKTITQTLVKSVSADASVKNLLEVMAENNRLGLLAEVAEQFQTLIRAGKGEIEVTITSASQLDSKTLSRLESAISKSPYANSKKLNVTNKVNDSILGGLVVEIGDRTIDLSVANRISKLNKLLTDAV